MNKKGGLIVASIIAVVAILLAILLITNIRATFISFTLDGPANNNWTTDTTPDFIFTATSNVTDPFNCTVYVNGTAEGSDPAVINATQTTITASPAIAEGRNYQWYVNCTDANETARSSTTRTINIDNTPPTVYIEGPGPANGTHTNANPIVFGVSARDNYNITNLSLYGTWNGGWHINTSWNPNGNFSGGVDIYGVEEGTFKWNYEACDIAGNCVFNESNNTIFVDRAPIITVLSPQNRTYNTSTIWFNATADESVDKWILNYNGTTNITITINSSQTVADGHYHLLLYANDSLGNVGLNNSIWFTVYNDSIGPDVVIDNRSFMLEEVNGSNMSVVGENVSIWGFVNDFSRNLTNWSIEVYDESGSLVNVACYDTIIPNNPFLCTWDTNVSCPDSECWNYSLLLYAYDYAGNYNETRFDNILIDNLPPQVDPSATLTLTTIDVGGPYTAKEWNLRTNITDTYLRDVNSFIFDNISANHINLIIAWAHLCNETQNNNCTSPGNGPYNQTWHADQYLINGELVSAHYTYYFPQDAHDGSSWFVSIPGCFSPNGPNNYSCLANCGYGSGPGCREWRWHLVYNVSNFTGNTLTGRLLGLVRDDWCDESGCNISSGLINPGVSRFKPQQDYFNFTGGELVENRSAIRLYNIGNPWNTNLTFQNAKGWYWFALTATDFWWSTGAAWGIYVDNELPVITLLNPAPNYYTNTNSTNITFNYSVTDDYSTILNCSIYNNGTDLGLNSVANGSVYNQTDTGLVDGTYSWYVNCTDESGNIVTSEIRNYTIDATAPIITSVSSTALITSAKISIGTDKDTIRMVTYNKNGSGTIVNSSWTITYTNSGNVSLSGLTASTLYYYNVSVCDRAGTCVSNNSDYNFTTTAATTNATRKIYSGTGGGGGTGGNITVCGDEICSSTESYATCPADCAPTQPGNATNNLGDLGTKAGKQSNGTGSENQSFSFIVKGKSHTALIAKISGNNVILWIWSEPVKVSLNVNEPKTLDLDGNGLAELEITLNSIKDGKAGLTFKEIPEIAPTPAPIPTPVKKGINWTLYIIIAAVAIVIILIIVGIAKRKK